MRSWPSAPSVTHRLGDANAEKIKVANARELEQGLLGQKVPDCISRGANVIGHKSVATARVNQRRLVLKPQRHTPAMRSSFNLLLAKYGLDRRLVHASNCS